MRSIAFAAAIATMLPLAGCSSSSEDEPLPDPGTPAELPELAPPASGFQLRTEGVTIEAGEDTEYCEVIELPGEPSDTYYVSGFEMAMTAFSHHLLVTAVNVGSAPEADLEVGSITKCMGAQQLAGFQDTEDVTGSQSPHSLIEFPEGVGKVFHGKQKLIIDYHYLNTSENPVPARHAVNVITTSKDKVQRIMQRSAFVNLTINTPPHSKAAFTGECHFSTDVMLWAAVRHTHRWGTNFDVWLAGGDDDGKHLWTSTDYELDTSYKYDDARHMKPGEGFRFRCEYDNTTDAPLTFGEKATDEMCILFGQWWVPNEADEVLPQFCLMTTTDDDGVSRGKNVSGTGDVPTN